jgi:protein-S-isoprenylcysteine O-methyltransferase Ste14
MSDVWLYVRCLFWVGCLTGLIFAPIVVWVGSRYFAKKENRHVVSETIDRWN